MRLSEHALLIGIGIAALYWMIETSLDALLFNEGTILQRLFPSDSNEVWMRVLVVSLILALSGTVQSNAKRRRAEKKMHENNAFFSGVLQIAGDGIIMVGASQHILLFNKGAEEIFGYHDSEVIGRHLNLLLPERFVDRHPQHVSAFGAEDESSRYMGNRRDELFGRRKNGEEFPAEVSISKLVQNGEILYSAVIRDVTIRKRHEDAIKHLNQSLEHRVKERTAELTASNKELEAFCYSVSHDLRSPLRGITGFSQALLEDSADKLDQRGKDYLERISKAGVRMGELIDELLNLSRVTRGEIHVEQVDLSAMVQNIAAELKRGNPDRSVKWTITEDLVAKGDTLLLQNVLQNLIANAWKFTSKNEVATIEFGKTSEFGKTKHEGKPAYFIRDDGAGFDMDYASKLFGPFQRLHGIREFPGNGIGLATVQRIIHRHVGAVWAEGAVGKGATFYFSI